MDSTLDLEAWRGLAGVHLDGRMAVALVGGLFVLLAYLLPMFPTRITSAETAFSDGTTESLRFPALISGQHYLQELPPPDAHPKDVFIAVAPATPHGGSGWAWLTQIIKSPVARGQHASYLVTVSLPLAAVCQLIGLAAWQQRRTALPLHMITLAVNAALLSVIALPLAWLHQVEFSLLLLSLAPAALAPRAGFWVAVAGSICALAGVWRLRGETLRRVFTW